MNEHDRTPSVGERSFSELTRLIRAADGLSLAQVCSMTGLEPSTVQNWIKRGFVPHPERKRYRERHVARILLIDALRDCLQIERVGELLRYVNGNADDTSDDAVTEEELYALFNSAASAVRNPEAPPRKADEIAASAVSAAVPDDEARERVIPALTVMLNACIAAAYKREADRLYEELISK